MRSFFIVPILALCAVWMSGIPAKAGNESIVAVVNQDAVTSSDLTARLDLIAASTGLPPSKELNDKLRPQVLDMLIDEQIKMQEAKRLRVSVSDEEIEQGFQSIAQQNNIPPDVFKKALIQRGIKLSTMQDQIRAQLAWTKIVQKRVRPRVEVSDADIDSELSQIEGNIGRDQYRIAEIFLPHSNEGGKDNDVRALAKKLSDQLQQQPDAFPKVARQFSQSAGAEQGGMIGWVFGSQMAEEVEKVLPNMAKGQVSQPVETAAGYYILFLVEKRQISQETMPSRDDVMQRIGTQRLDRAQRRYLMDLYSSSFIERRI